MFSRGDTREPIKWLFGPFIAISLPGLIIVLILRIIKFCLPFLSACPPPKINRYLGFLIASIFNLIFYFFVGALIVLMTQKIKEKRK